MIYFLTDWQSEMNSLESNAMFNVNKVLNAGEMETKMINTKVSPFSNYFVNQFEFFDSKNMIDLLETVSHKFVSSHTPITMNDLHLPENYEKTYTRTNVLLSRNGVVKGEVYFNQFGFVSEVCYYIALGKEIHLYSEKGYVLSKEVIDQSGNQIEKKVFDESGELIFTEWGNYIFIGEAYRKYFKEETYATFKDICIELVNNALINFNPSKDRIIVEGSSSWLMDIVEGFSFPEAIVYVFSGSEADDELQVKTHAKLIEKGKAVITDNLLLQKRIENENNDELLQSKTHLIPLYPTTFTLGESNRYAEQYVYWQINVFDSQMEALLKKILQLKLIINDLCLIIESLLSTDEAKIQQLMNAFIYKNFGVDVTSADYELVKQYYEALGEGKMTSSLRELFNDSKREKAEFRRVIDAYLFFKSVTIKSNSDARELKEDFEKVRIFVDQRDGNKFFNHSLAASAGIPIFSKQVSPYLLEGKNGKIFHTEEQLLTDIESYLISSDKWNQALVESVEIIQDCSADGLVRQWKEVLI